MLEFYFSNRIMCIATIFRYKKLSILSIKKKHILLFLLLKGLDIQKNIFLPVRLDNCEYIQAYKCG
jgi:hypothetical protein